MKAPAALVTGASSGIGLELARLLAVGGHDLILVARSAESLEIVARELREQHGVSVLAIPQDLSIPGAAHVLWRRLLEDAVTVDVLINNAGIGLSGPFAEQDLDAVDRLVALNVLALTTLTRLVLPGMLARRRGRILNVASVVAYQPGGPGMAAYYATKSFVLSFSKGLARELSGTGVTTTALAPGTTKTNFERRAGASDTPLYRFVRGSSAKTVARAAYRGMMRGSAVVLPGFLTKMFAIAGELPPRRIALEVNRWLLHGGRKKE